MSSFEWTFILDEADDVGDLLDRYDCLTGINHDGEGFVAITCPGETGLGAAKSMCTELQLAGFRVLRSQEDLVDRHEIAQRTGNSRQSVGQWIRGERGSGFPARFNDVGGGVWLWGDVHRWLRRTGRDLRGDDLDYPTREDHDLLNAYLLNGCQDPIRDASMRSSDTDTIRLVHRALRRQADSAPSPHGVRLSPSDRIASYLNLLTRVTFDTRAGGETRILVR